jgi:hypothetical protein
VVVVVVGLLAAAAQEDIDQAPSAKVLEAEYLQKVGFC